MESKDKLAVKEFWNEASCGENLYLASKETIEDYAKQSTIRFELEPYILDSASFKEGRGKKYWK